KRESTHDKSPPEAGRLRTDHKPFSRKRQHPCPTGPFGPFPAARATPRGGATAPTRGMQARSASENRARTPCGVGGAERGKVSRADRTVRFESGMKNGGGGGACASPAAAGVLLLVRGPSGGRGCSRIDDHAVREGLGGAVHGGLGEAREH